MITVIAPHARPEFSDNLLQNFRRQLGVHARLVVVSNGLGKITWPKDVCVLRSDRHQAKAMNLGLDWLRKNGNNNWARFDDDDYYGPNYLSVVEKSLAGSSTIISGMPWRFVMLDDGLHKFHCSGDFTGGSLAASTADVIDFPVYSDDDLRWCRGMRKNGATLIERNAHGYCYDRRTRNSERVIPGGTAVTRFGFGKSSFYGNVEISEVDNESIVPITELSEPTDDEILTELGYFDTGREICY